MRFDPVNPGENTAVGPGYTAVLSRRCSRAVAGAGSLSGPGTCCRRPGGEPLRARCARQERGGEPQHRAGADVGAEAVLGGPAVPAADHLRAGRAYRAANVRHGSASYGSRCRGRRRAKEKATCRTDVDRDLNGDDGGSLPWGDAHASYGILGRHVANVVRAGKSASVGWPGWPSRRLTCSAMGALGTRSGRARASLSHGGRAGWHLLVEGGLLLSAAGLQHQVVDLAARAAGLGGEPGTTSRPL